MKGKSLWRISIATSREAEEPVTELLASLADQPASSFFHLETRKVTVSTYFEKKPTGLAALLQELHAGLVNIRRCGLDVRPGKILSTRIPRESWAHSWKRHFKPLEIGDALLIKPSWVRRKAKRGQALVVLDPGLSFGTGQHPTTEFCLRQIVKQSAKNKLKPRGGHADVDLNRQSCKPSLLDVGTGSGILAIAAAKLGFAPVVAFDFDPESVRVASANARKNGVATRMRLSRQDLTRLPLRSAIRYDVVCANLISTLLIAERKRIVARLKPDGVLVLAGILKSEFMLVEKAFGKLGFRLKATTTRKEWRSGAFVIKD